jgi:hypothetical protein
VNGYRRFSTGTDLSDSDNDLTALGACATIQYRAKRVLLLAAEGD